MEYNNLIPNLMVRDVAATIAYYSDVLDFDVVATVPGESRPVFGIVRSGGVMLMFQEEQSLKDEYPQLAACGPVAGLTLYIHVDAVSPLYDNLKGRARIAKDLHTTFYGSQDFAIEDCNGYILTFSQDAGLRAWRYDNYFLPSADMDASRQFYSEVLGLKVKFDFPAKGMTAWHVGDEEPAIILKDLSVYPGARSAVWFEVDDVPALYDKLRVRGVRFLSEPFSIATGMAVEFLDPSGNLLGLTDYKKMSDVKC